MSASGPHDFTSERRSRLAGAVLGAPGQELVTIRAADLRICLRVAERVQEAQQLVGENDVLQRDLLARSHEAAQVPELRRNLVAAQGRIDALKAEAARAAMIPALEEQLAYAKAQNAILVNRITLARRMLRGDT